MYLLGGTHLANFVNGWVVFACALCGKPSSVAISLFLLIGRSYVVQVMCGPVRGARLRAFEGLTVAGRDL